MLSMLFFFLMPVPLQPSHEQGIHSYPIHTWIIPGFDFVNHHITLTAEVGSICRSFFLQWRSSIYMLYLSQDPGAPAWKQVGTQSPADWLWHSQTVPALPPLLPLSSLPLPPPASFSVAAWKGYKLQWKGKKRNFFKIYILLFMLLQLSQFFPFCSPPPCSAFHPAIPSPLVRVHGSSI